MDRKKLFIVFEGIDGSGKSTQMDLLSKRILEDGNEVITTCEPTILPSGKFIRDILSANVVLNQATLAALFLADRIEHILHPNDGILDQLKSGNHVISDRYYFSSLAFQSEYVPMQWIANANKICKDLLIADFTFYIQVDPHICFERIKEGRKHLEIFEHPEKLQLTHEKYLEAFNQYGDGENIITVDGNRSKEDIHLEILSYLNLGV